MPFSKHINVLLLFALVAACAPVTTAPLDAKAVVSRTAKKRYTPQALSSAEQGLHIALDAYKAGNFDAVLIIARQTADQCPDSIWSRRMLFLAEQAFIQLDRPAEADAAMLRVRSEYPELADYAVSALADYHFAKARYTRSAALYQQVAEQYPKSLLAVRAQYRRSLSLLESFAFAPAIESFEKFLQERPGSEFAPDAALGLGRALLAEAGPDSAVRAFRDVWVRYTAPADQEAANMLTDLAAGGVEVAPWTIEELTERGKNLFRANQYDKVVETYGKLLERDPNPPARTEVLFCLGIALYNTGKRSEAAQVLEKMVKDYPADQRVPEALNWIGKSYSKLGDRDKGIKAFQRILDQYAESEWADDALFLTGNIYRETNDMKKALVYYGRLAAEYPESKFADSAIWWKAWAYYGAADYKKAEQTLQELVRRYPRSFLANQARYWLGRIAEKQGDRARAAAYYGQVMQKGPYTYYGYRTVERMAGLEVTTPAAPVDSVQDNAALCDNGPCPEDPLSSFAFDTDDGPPVWTEETQQLLAADPLFRTTLELMHLDMKKEAAAELWSLQDRLPRMRGALIGTEQSLLRSRRLLPLAASSCSGTTSVISTGTTTRDARGPLVARLSPGLLGQHRGLLEKVRPGPVLHRCHHPRGEPVPRRCALAGRRARRDAGDARHRRVGGPEHERSGLSTGPGSLNPGRPSTSAPGTSATS